MKASGNGSIGTCVTNLLRMVRGEVPYERVKGIDPRMIDKPIATVLPDVRQDAQWLLEIYEPRAAVENINVTQSDGVAGGLLITANIKGEGEVSNG